MFAVVGVGDAGAGHHGHAARHRCATPGRACPIPKPRSMVRRFTPAFRFDLAVIQAGLRRLVLVVRRIAHVSYSSMKCVELGNWIRRRDPSRGAASASVAAFGSRVRIGMGMRVAVHVTARGRAGGAGAPLIGRDNRCR